MKSKYYKPFATYKIYIKNEYYYTFDDFLIMDNFSKPNYQEYFVSGIFNRIFKNMAPENIFENLINKKHVDLSWNNKSSKMPHYHMIKSL